MMSGVSIETYHSAMTAAGYHKTYVKPELQLVFELLMISGVSIETC
jgi:hypothetical protein